jgi:hypothetical protein
MGAHPEEPAPSTHMWHKSAEENALATADLLWRAKLAGEPRRSPWQLQRIYPIAFQAANRPWALPVNRHH